MNAVAPAEEPVDLLKLIGLEDARQLMLGRGGRPPTIETTRKWSQIGYRPLGWTGPRLILRTVRTSTDILTLPQWVREFEAKRAEMGSVPPPVRRQATGTCGGGVANGGGGGSKSDRVLRLENEVLRGDG